MAFVAHQTAETQMWCLGGRAGEIDYGGGCDAAAVVADVDLHEYARADLIGVGGLVEVGEILRVIDRDHNVATSGQGHEALDLAATDDFVGNENVMDAGVGHDFGLPDLGAGDPLRAGCELEVGDGWGFVRLGVRPEVFARRAEVLGEQVNVVFERVEIDQEDGGVDGVAGHADVFGSHNQSFVGWVDIVCELCWMINVAVLIPYLTDFASYGRRASRRIGLNNGPSFRSQALQQFF